MSTKQSMTMTAQTRLIQKQVQLLQRSELPVDPSLIHLLSDSGKQDSMDSDGNALDLFSDDPDSAFEEINASTNSLASFYESIARSMFYPGLVAVLAYACFAFSLIYFQPQIEHTLVIARAPESSLVAPLRFLGDHFQWWSWAFPVLVVAVVVQWKYMKSKSSLEFRGLLRPLCWFPGYQRAIHYHRLAIFVSYVHRSFLQTNDLSNSLKTADELVNHRSLSKWAVPLASQVLPFVSQSGKTENVPSLIRWVAGLPKSEVADALAFTAGEYRRFANGRMKRIETLMPLLLLFFIGGLTAFVYALSIFGPFTLMLQSISRSL